MAEILWVSNPSPGFAASGGGDNGGVIIAAAVAEAECEESADQLIATGPPHS